MGEPRSVWMPSYSAGALLTRIGALLLGCSLAQPSSASCPMGETYSNLTQPMYHSIQRADTGFLSVVVTSFLHTIQPNSFPKDLLFTFVNGTTNTYSNEQTIKKVLLYEVGFLVCAAIGIVYIILMPVVGFFLACCRCCGNCGGQMYQQQTKAVDCRRRGLYWATLLTTLVILAGNICMFFSNQSLKKSVDDSSLELNNTLDNLQTYLNAVPLQIDNVLLESNNTVESVKRDLSEIGPLLGSAIQKDLQVPLYPALQSVRDISQVVNSTAVLLVSLNSTLSQLQTSTSALQANVQSVRDNINRTLTNSACSGCIAEQSVLKKLTFDTTIKIPNLYSLQSAVDNATKANLSSKVVQGEDFFASIPKIVTNDTKNVVQNGNQQLEDIMRQISAVKGDLPVTALNNVSETLSNAKNYVGKYSPDIEWVDFIRWAVCITMCSVVLLVIVCNLLGLFLGPMGLSPRDDPTERSGTADCGGTFLMAGAGLSFLFSWLFMLLVLILFLLGGNVYTLLCQPWSNGQLLQIIDTPGLIPGLNLGKLLGLKTNLTLSEVYNDCEQNKPLWTTLHLYELINLNDLLNVSKYTAEIQQNFDRTEIKLPRINLLTPEINQQLSSFSDTAHGINFSSVRQQINNIYNINVNETAKVLEELARIQTNQSIKNELVLEATNLTKIQTDIETTIIPKLIQLNSSINSLSVIASQINGTIKNVFSKVGIAQNFLNSNITQVVKAESQVFLDCMIGYITAYADWANFTITQQVGLCGPVAKAVDSAEEIVCKNVTESLNAFWFSLGWCLIFLIPSIIFSIKLAKFYRRMKHSDVYDNHIPMHSIPRAHTKHF
ncbi:hypothetical protein UPYG_G00320770 [Umbra pygmaea]|uniref:Prominin 2 n=1 Tax=Umbra pygmaea TaxID=75934 RepID=A0ABD0W0D1_UMBPY